MAHTFFENVRITPLTVAAGTIINATAQGTAQGTVAVADYEYHALCYAGTIANTGTIFVYAMASGQTSSVLGSIEVGSSNGNAIFEVKSDTVTNEGTIYTHLGANIVVDSGGTWRGAAFWASHQPRSAGTTPAALGWAAVGTSLT